jgi:hypothetical protein
VYILVAINMMAWRTPVCALSEDMRLYCCGLQM